MSIISASIGTTTLNSNPRLVIRMVARDENGSMPTPNAPFELVGMYNGVVGAVELYVGNASATSFLKVFS